MIFLIETVKHKIEDDFSFHLRKAVDFQNWIHNNKNYMIISYVERQDILHNNFKLDNESNHRIIPIGSVEYVIKYLNQYYNIIPKPINIPNELLSFNFTGRNVFNGTEKDIKNKCFVKSNDIIKFKINNGNDDFTGFYSQNDIIPIGNYQISDIIDIESEYRCFVYQKELVGIQHYLGDFKIFPNIDKIIEMIESYTSQPIAYTLDVGITNNNETIIIEVHDFFSVGLYGFANYNILPYMFSRWFFEKIKNNKIF